MVFSCSGHKTIAMEQSCHGIIMVMVQEACSLTPQSSLCKQNGGGNPLTHLSVFSIDFFDRFNHIGELSAVLVQPLHISHA